MALLHSIWRNARIRFPAITTAACFICGQRSEMPCRGFCKLKLRTGRFDLPCNEWAGEAFEVGDLSGMRPPISSTRKMGRIAYEQKLRRALERHFPKFKITRLTRQETQSSIDASLTVAIVWLDVCRKAQAGPLRCASLRSRNVRALPRKDRCRPLRIAFTGANRESRYFRLWKGQCPRPPPFPARKYRRAAIPPSCQHHWPPELDWTPRLISALLDADRLVGRLAGEASRLPHPHILIRPFLQREAVLSSKSEGTQATLGELLAAEAGALVDHSPEDLREVATTCFAANCMGIRRD